MTINNCPRCQLLESIDRLDTDQLVTEQLKLEVGNIVSNEIREQRLTICQQCPFFQNGICQKCGCYTKFRASLKNKKCPVKRW